MVLRVVEPVHVFPDVFVDCSLVGSDPGMDNEAS